jgi:hypothetical protein
MNVPSGLRIPLIIDASMLIGGLITLTLMWSDVRSLKQSLAQTSQQITDGRIVRLEEQYRALADEQKDTKDQLKALWRRGREP